MGEGEDNLRATSASGLSGGPATFFRAAACALSATLLVPIGTAGARPLSDDTLASSTALEPQPTPPAGQPHLVFPVVGEARLTDDWHQPRDNGARLHMGVDIGADKHAPLVAVADAVVIELRHGTGGGAGNMLVLEDREGWRYTYMHLNNDTPGTDDGRNRFVEAFGSGVRVGLAVAAGDLVGYLGDSGNAEPNTPHLHFELRRPDGLTIDPYQTLLSASPADEHAPQYLCRGAANSSFTREGDGGAAIAVAALADIRLRHVLDSPPHDYIDVASSRDGAAMWALTATGTVEVLGTARHFGAPSRPDLSSQLVAIEPSRSGRGYWLLEATGRVHPFGDAVDYGSPGVVAPSEAVDLVTTPAGRGYLVLARDGAVSAHGDALDLGSAVGSDLEGTFDAVMIRASADGSGYWVLAEDGRVTTFGDAVFRGRWAGAAECEWGGAVGAIATLDRTGWWMIDVDLQSWAFGTARGSTLDYPERPDLGLAVAIS